MSALMILQQVHGGSWDDVARYSQVAYRDTFRSDYRDEDVGFRVVVVGGGGKAQALCQECWTQEYPDMLPHHVIRGAREETCVKCRAGTAEGIYVLYWYP